MALRFSPLLSALPILPLNSNGDLIAPIKRLLMLGSPFYSQPQNNISSHMGEKLDKISSECSKQVTALSSGFYNTLE
jgi:hypothetical protein